MMDILQDPDSRVQQNGVPTTYVCEQCEATFDEKETLLNHKKNNHKETFCVCDVCPATFTSKDALMIHKLKHVRSRSYKCEWCDKTYATMPAYKLHVAQHSEDDPFKCDECEQSYFKAFDLVAHKLAHSRLNSALKRQEIHAGENQVNKFLVSLKSKNEKNVIISHVVFTLMIKKKIIASYVVNILVVLLNF